MNEYIEFYIKAVIAAVTCLAAAAFDIKKGIIPNKLTFSMILVGLAINVCLFAWKELIISLMVIIALFFIGMLDIIGLGDIKLIMAVTAVGGAKMSGAAFLIGILALCFYAVFFNPYETSLYVQDMKKRLRFKKVKLYKKSTKYAFAPYMLFGTMVYSLLLSPLSPLNGVFHTYILGW